jgi:glutamate dehydrogenase/leucine dehydrogenase
VIHERNAKYVEARVISSIANNPITDEAEYTLFERNVHVVPDFLANVGGVVVAMVDMLGGTADNLFHSLDSLLLPMTREILEDARAAGIPPRILAVKRIKERILKARTNKEVLVPFDELLDLAKKRLNL